VIAKLSAAEGNEHSQSDDCEEGLVGEHLFACQELSESQEAQEEPISTRMPILDCEQAVQQDQEQWRGEDEGLSWVTE
jgi:hypothetical protein